MLCACSSSCLYTTREKRNFRRFPYRIYVFLCYCIERVYSTKMRVSDTTPPFLLQKAASERSEQRNSGTYHHPHLLKRYDFSGSQQWKGSFSLELREMKSIESASHSGLVLLLSPEKVFYSLCRNKERSKCPHWNIRKRRCIGTRRKQNKTPFCFLFF